MFLHGTHFELNATSAFFEGKEVDQEDGSTVYVGPLSLDQNIAKLENLTSLKICNSRIKSLPNEVCLLQNLVTLRLEKNEGLCSLPENLNKLCKLSFLIVSDSSIHSLPDMKGMSMLRTLHLPRNRFILIPETIKNLEQLSELIFSSNRLENIPEVLSTLTELRDLDLSHNRIREIPKSLLQGIKKLKRINLDYNDLEHLPEEICDLPELEQLSVNRNNLLEFPASMSKLENLKFLSVRDNCITTVDLSHFRKLTMLNDLNLSGNPLIDPVFASEKRTGQVNMALNPQGQQLIDKLSQAYKELNRRGR